MILDMCSEDPIDGQVLRLQRRCNLKTIFGRMLKINLKMDYEAILKIKFVDQLWRSIEINSSNFGYLIQRYYQNYHISLPVSLRIDLQS